MLDCFVRTKHIVRVTRMQLVCLDNGTLSSSFGANLLRIKLDVRGAISDPESQYSSEGREAIGLAAEKKSVYTNSALWYTL